LACRSEFRGCRHEARVKGVCFVVHDVLNRGAGVVEGGLDDGVVLARC
jgi:hypothetical protein